MEGGDDIGVAGPGIEKNAGAAGFDWSIGLGDPQAQDADLALLIVAAGLAVIEVRDRFNEVEALSGWKFNDILRGDDVMPRQVGGGGFIGCDALDQAGLDRIAGLDAIVPPLRTVTRHRSSPLVDQLLPARPATSGARATSSSAVPAATRSKVAAPTTSSTATGTSNVRLSVRTNPAIPASEIGSTDLMEHTAPTGTSGRARPA